MPRNKGRQQHVESRKIMVVSFRDETVQRKVAGAASNRTAFQCSKISPSGCHIAGYLTPFRMLLPDK